MLTKRANKCFDAIYIEKGHANKTNRITKISYVYYEYILQVRTLLHLRCLETGVRIDHPK